MVRMSDHLMPRPGGMGAGPRRPRGLGRGGSSGTTAPAAPGPGLVRLFGGDPLITLTRAEAELVVALLDQVKALGAMTGREPGEAEVALAEKLRERLHHDGTPL